MDNFDEILEQLRKEYGNVEDGNLHIIEEIIPVEEQMNYFDWSKKVRSSHDIEHKTYWISLLFTPEIDIQRKRDSLSILAGLTDISSYRAIETYHSSPLEPELANWSAMALMESKILISSDLSGEKQILISTGLGGSDQKLRFFSVLATSNREDFTPLQKEMLTREFNFQFEKHKIKIEEFTFQGNFLKMRILSSIENSLKNVFNIVVEECNQYGNFIDEKYLLTNVRIFDNNEISRLLDKNKEKGADPQQETENI